VILGIDAGGTNYDAVAFEDGSVVSAAKRSADTDDGFETLLAEVVEKVDGSGNAEVDRVVVSTTRVLNSAVQNRLPDCTNVVVPGVGLSPELAYSGDENLVADGCVDHRGRVTEPLEIDGEPSHGVVAVTAKFSTRNPSLETEASESLDAPTVALGHESGGALGFPSRAETTVANAKSKPVFESFESSLHDALDETGIDAPVYYLKGDAAMLSRESARTTPAHTLRSGPASSSLGLVALTERYAETPSLTNAVCVDIGGTTTDVTLVKDGFPALVDEVEAGCISTFYDGVVAVNTTAGGDTRLDEDGLTGVRDGPAVAFGGPSPTPTDALQFSARFRRATRRRRAKHCRRSAIPNRLRRRLSTASSPRSPSRYGRLKDTKTYPVRSSSAVRSPTLSQAVSQTGSTVSPTLSFLRTPLSAALSAVPSPRSAYVRMYTSTPHAAR